MQVSGNLTLFNRRILLKTMWLQLVLISALAITSGLAKCPVPINALPIIPGLAQCPVPVKDRVFGCYFGSWAVYRPGNGRFDVDDIDPTLCTHLFYGFVGINSDGSVRIMDSWNEIDKAALNRFSGLKAKNPKLKVLLAIGGWNEGSTVFSNVANSPALRSNFIRSTISLIRTHNFDGFDLDWEYPAQRGGAAYDVQNFVTLIRELRAEYDKPENRYLLTAAVAAAGASVDQSYDVPRVAELLDFINLMTYDLHGAWDGATGHNAPLYPSSKDITELQRSLNVDASVKGWIARGATPDKLVLGIGLYGRTFTLADPSNTGIGSAAYNGGQAGQYTRESGFLGYNEIVELFKQGGWTATWDDEQAVPYAAKGNQWIGYDNQVSIECKVKYAIGNCLRGAMVWSLETDDFRGLNGTRNPLLNTIKTTLGLPEVVVTEPVTQAPGSESGGSGSGSGGSEPGSGGSGSGSSSTTTTTPGPTQAPVISGGSILCGGPGLIRDTDDCSKFYNCAYSGAIIQATQCQAGLLFDESLKVCNWASQVSCP